MPSILILLVLSMPVVVWPSCTVKSNLDWAFFLPKIRTSVFDGFIYCNGWFHLQCVNLTEDQLPDGDWFCAACSESSTPLQDSLVFLQESLISDVTQVPDRDEADPPGNAVVDTLPANLLNNLLTRLNNLEKSNTQLINRVEYLESQLKLKNANKSKMEQQNDKLVKGLKLVTDTSYMLLNKFDDKEQELQKLRSDVAVLTSGKGNPQGVNEKKVGEEVDNIDEVAHG